MGWVYFCVTSYLGEGVSRDDLDPGSVDELEQGSEPREVGGLGGGWVGCWRIFCPSTDLDLWKSEDLNSCIYLLINQSINQSIDRRIFYPFTDQDLNSCNTKDLKNE